MRSGRLSHGQRLAELQQRLATLESSIAARRRWMADHSLPKIVNGQVHLHPDYLRQLEALEEEQLDVAVVVIQIKRIKRDMLADAASLARRRSTIRLAATRTTSRAPRRAACSSGRPGARRVASRSADGGSSGDPDSSGPGDAGQPHLAPTRPRRYGREVCVHCGRVLLFASGRLICANVGCRWWSR